MIALKYSFEQDQCFLYEDQTRESINKPKQIQVGHKHTQAPSLVYLPAQFAAVILVRRILRFIQVNAVLT